MSVEAVCFTSSGSNGRCWVVLVMFLGILLFFVFLKKGFFFHTRRTPPQKKTFMRLTPYKNFLVGEEKRNLRQKKLHNLCQKIFTQLTPPKQSATYAYFRN